MLILYFSFLPKRPFLSFCSILTIYIGASLVGSGLELNFSGAKPTEFSSLKTILAQYDVDSHGHAHNIYGIFTFEEGVGMKVNMSFHGSVIALVDNTK